MPPIHLEERVNMTQLVQHNGGGVEKPHNREGSLCDAACLVGESKIKIQASFTVSSRQS